MTARDIADNATLQIASRLAMLSLPILFGATVWLGAAWLDGRFASVATATAEVVARVNNIESERLPIRVTVLENNNSAILSRLDRIQDSQATMAVALGSLAATMRIQTQN